MEKSNGGSMSKRLVLGMVLLMLCFGCGPRDEEERVEKSVQKKIDVCGMATQDELSRIYRKPLIAKEDGNGCIWSLEPDGMAYMHIAVQEKKREIRNYFNAEIPSHVELKVIDDLGDEGLMTVAEGSLGVVIIAKGSHIVRSAVTFLDIEPGTTQQQELWKLYGRILQQI